MKRFGNTWVLTKVALGHKTQARREKALIQHQKPALRSLGVASTAYIEPFSLGLNIRSYDGKFKKAPDCQVLVGKAKTFFIFQTDF